MISGLPEEVRKLICGEDSSPAAYTGKNDLHGMIISRGKNRTTNMTFISKYPSWALLKKGTETSCNIPGAVLDEPTYASLVSEYADSLVTTMVQYGRKWSYLR